MTHSFPTRRPSDLAALARRRAAGIAEHGGRLQPRSCRLPRLHDRASRQSADARGNDGAADGGFSKLAGAARGAKLQKDLDGARAFRSEEHTSELQSLMRISYAVFCWKKKKR